MKETAKTFKLIHFPGVGSQPVQLIPVDAGELKEIRTLIEFGYGQTAETAMTLIVNQLEGLGGLGVEQLIQCFQALQLLKHGKTAPDQLPLDVIQSLFLLMGVSKPVTGRLIRDQPCQGSNQGHAVGFKAGPAIQHGKDQHLNLMISNADMRFQHGTVGVGRGRKYEALKSVIQVPAVLVPIRKGLELVQIHEIVELYEQTG